MATKKNATKTDAPTDNDMIDAGLAANAPAAPSTNATSANAVIATEFGTDERSAQRLKKATKKAAVSTAPAPTPEQEVANTMVEGGLATDFRSDEERAKSARKRQAKAVVDNVIAATKAEGTTPAVVAQPAPVAKTKKVKAAPVMPGDATLSRVAEHYLKHLEERGGGAGTIASYGMELKLAMSELGAATRIAELTPARVQAFFDCARVTLLRGGKEKSPLSIAKTRRVLRLALVHAAETGLIANAPIPEKTPAA